MKFDLSNDIDVKNFRSRTEYLIKKEAKVDLTEKQHSRSLDQNKFLHVCFTYVAQETGYTIEEAKHVLKMDFGKFMKYTKGDFTFYRSTASLNKNECSEFIEWIRAMAARELGVCIPSSDEYYQNAFDIEKQLQFVK